LFVCFLLLLIHPPFFFQKEHDQLKAEYAALSQASGQGTELKNCHNHLRESQQRVAELEDALEKLHNIKVAESIAEEASAEGQFARQLEMRDVELQGLKEALEESQSHCLELQREKEVEVQAKVMIVRPVL